MNDDLRTTTPVDLPPAPPEPPLAAAPGVGAEPWQVRLEILAVLLVLAAALLGVARLVTAYDAPAGINVFEGESPDIVEVVRTAGLAVGPTLAGALLVAFLLVTLGPGQVLGRSGVLALRGVVGVGLPAAGLAAFAGAAVIIDPDAAGPFGDAQSTVHDLVSRLGYGAPALAAAAIAGYVAWCAFSTLGEVPEVVVAEPGTDLGTAAEGSWGPSV